jgi:hypothetical protein
MVATGHRPIKSRPQRRTSPDARRSRGLEAGTLPLATGGESNLVLVLILKKCGDRSIGRDGILMELDPSEDACSLRFGFIGYCIHHRYSGQRLEPTNELRRRIAHLHAHRIRHCDR